MFFAAFKFAQPRGVGQTVLQRGHGKVAGQHRIVIVGRRRQIRQGPGRDAWRIQTGDPLAGQRRRPQGGVRQASGIGAEGGVGHPAVAEQVEQTERIAMRVQRVVTANRIPRAQECGPVIIIEQRQRSRALQAGVGTGGRAGGNLEQCAGEVRLATPVKEGSGFESVVVAGQRMQTRVGGQPREGQQRSLGVGGPAVLPLFSGQHPVQLAGANSRGNGAFEFGQHLRSLAEAAIDLNVEQHRRARSGKTAGQQGAHLGARSSRAMQGPCRVKRRTGPFGVDQRGARGGMPAGQHAGIVAYFDGVKVCRRRPIGHVMAGRRQQQFRDVVVLARPVGPGVALRRFGPAGNPPFGKSAQLDQFRQLPERGVERLQIAQAIFVAALRDGHPPRLIDDVGDSGAEQKVVQCQERRRAAGQSGPRAARRRRAPRRARSSIEPPPSSRASLTNRSSSRPCATRTRICRCPRRGKSSAMDK